MRRGRRGAGPLGAIAVGGGIPEAWRAGAELFREIWPLVEKYEPEGEFRREFTTDLLDLFPGCDVDPEDLRRLHPEVDRAPAAIESRPWDEGEEVG